jgi:hypothetical protein
MITHQADRDESRPSPATALYTGPGIVVTRRWLIGPGYRYPIAQLRGAVRTQGRRHPSVSAAMFIAGVNVLLLVPVAVVDRGAPMLLMAAGAVLVPCLVAWVCQRWWPPRQELLARHHGGTVHLFASRDEREFGQVSRAVQRAIEAVPREWL